MDRGAPNFGLHNAFFAQFFVGPVLWMLCGMCWALTSRPLYRAIGRLIFYVCIVVMVNGCALLWAGRGLEFTERPLQLLIAPAWFVIELAALMVITAPLKSKLCGLRENFDDLGEEPPSDDEAAALNVSGDVKTEVKQKVGPSLSKNVSWRGFVVLLGFFVLLLLNQLLLSFLPMNSGKKRLVGQATMCMGSLLLAYNGTTWLQTWRGLSGLPWVLIFYSLWARVLIVTPRYGSSEYQHMFLGADMFVVGLLAAKLGLRFAPFVGTKCQRYWWCVVGLHALCYDPLEMIRLDLHPTGWMGMNARNMGSVLLWVLCWLTASEKMFDARIMTENGMSWLRDWGVVLYITHEALYVVAPGMIAWLIFLGLVPFARFLRNKRLGL